jgi:hypothetical protein
MQRKTYLLIIAACVLMFVITRFVNYLGDNASAYDKAPLLHGKGVIEKIEFIPAHEEKITRRTGRRRVITNTYHVADAFSIKVHIDEENKTGAFLTYDITDGGKWQEADKVNVDYKKTKLFFFTPKKIFIERITKL